MTGPYAIRSATESTAIIDKDRVAISVSLHRLTRMPRVPDSAEPLAGLDNTMGQPDADMRKTEEGSNQPTADPKRPEPTEYVIDRVAEHRGTETRTKYKVR